MAKKKYPAYKYPTKKSFFIKRNASQFEHISAHLKQVAQALELCDESIYSWSASIMCEEMKQLGLKVHNMINALSTIDLNNALDKLNKENPNV